MPRQLGTHPEPAQPQAAHAKPRSSTRQTHPKKSPSQPEPTKPYPTRAQRAETIADLRDEQGCTWSAIAAVYRREYPGINPRRAYRFALNLTHDEIAQTVNSFNAGQPTLTKGRVCAFETDPGKDSRRNPTIPYLRNLARVFQTTGIELLTEKELAHYDKRGELDEIRQIDYRHLDENHHPRQAEHPPTTSPQATNSSANSRRTAENNHPPIDQVLAIAASGSGNTVRATADDLGQLVHHYSRELFHGHPADSYAQLTLARQFAGTVLDGARSTATDTEDLAAATGWISILLAMAASHQGHSTASIIWSSDAERMSIRSGNTEIAAWAALTRAVTAYYQGDVHTSAAIAGSARQLSAKGTAVHAKLAAHEMRSWATAGNLDAMMKAKQAAAESIGRHRPSTTNTVFSLVPSEEPPYTATSFLALGRYQDALATTNRVLESGYRPISGNPSRQPTAYARTLMVLALAHVGLGDGEAAADIGHKALSSAPEVWPTLVLARSLDSRLHHDFGRMPIVHDFHARYLQAVDATTLADISDNRRPV